MTRYLFTYAMAGLLAIATTVAAQGPPPSPQPPSNPQTPATPQTSPQRPAPAMQPTSSAAVTVEGCLVREKDIGREPNVAERAGIQEDFILTNARVVKGSAPSDVARTGQTPKPGTDATRAGQPTAGQTASTQPMYDVKELDADRLKELVGKRVQIEGSWGDTQRSATAGAVEDLVDIKGTTIKEVPGQCTPPKP